MENLCQRVSVTNSIHLTAKIMLLFVPDIHLWTVVRPNFTSCYSLAFAMVAQNFAIKIYFAQNLRRRQSPF